jgi:hypothetical protein
LLERPRRRSKDNNKIDSGLLGFGLRPSSDILKNTEEENVSQTGSVSVYPHLRTERDTVSETLCSLEFFRIPEDRQSQKPSNPECHALSSEAFRIY